jgi:DNA-binding MarR family transcriptional regulator
LNNRVDRLAITERILDLSSQAFDSGMTRQTHPFQAVELTMPQIKALLAVVDWGRVSGSQLARILEVGLPSVTRLIDRLEQHGLITRQEDAEDRRVTWIAPTETGRQAVESLRSFRRECLGALLARLEIEQLEVIQCAMEYLAGAAREAAGSKSAGLEV